jgi:hypothetical protein
MVKHAQIADEDKVAIAGGNLDRISGGGAVINNTSQLAQEFWQQGRLARRPILDFHAHMYDCAGLFLPRCTPEAMLRTMDACNSVLTLFAGHESLAHPVVGVEKDMEAARRYPDRLKAYHPVISRHLDPKADLKRMDDNPDLFAGFKFHPSWYGVPLSDPRHDPYWEYADAHRLLVLSHTWGGSAVDGPEEAEKVLRRYQHLVFIAGHSFHTDWPRAAALATEFPNFYAELTAVLDNRGGLEVLVEGQALGRSSRHRPPVVLDALRHRRRAVCGDIGRGPAEHPLPQWREAAAALPVVRPDLGSAPNGVTAGSRVSGTATALLPWPFLSEFIGVHPWCRPFPPTLRLLDSSTLRPRASGGGVTTCSTGRAARDQEAAASRLLRAGAASMTRTRSPMRETWGARNGGASAE